MSYTFISAEHCNMCGHPTQDATILGRRLNAHQGRRPTHRQGVTTSIQRCRSCGLVFPNPMPVPSTVGQHYDRPPEDYWTDEYLERGDSQAEYYIADFQRRWSGTRAHPKALDVGAGVGHSMRALQAAGFATWGIEPSEPFRAKALAGGDISEDRLLHAAIETADLPDREFDFINMGAVVEHLVDPAGAIERAEHWLAPEGLIWIGVPSSDWLVARALNLAYRLQGLDFVTNTSPMHPPFHLYEFTRRSFEVHGQRVGYRIASSRVVVCDTFMPRLLKPAAYRLMDTTGTGMILEVWLASQ
jgi:SAM-dependent methyltransferase